MEWLGQKYFVVHDEKQITWFVKERLSKPCKIWSGATNGTEPEHVHLIKAPTEEGAPIQVCACLPGLPPVWADFVHHAIVSAVCSIKSNQVFNAYEPIRLATFSAIGWFHWAWLQVPDLYTLIDCETSTCYWACLHNRIHWQQVSIWSNEPEAVHTKSL